MKEEHRLVSQQSVFPAISQVDSLGLCICDIFHASYLFS